MYSESSATSEEMLPDIHFFLFLMSSKCKNIDPNYVENTFGPLSKYSSQMLDSLGNTDLYI